MPAEQPVIKKKMACDYKYVANNRIVTIEAGRIISGAVLDRVMKAHPDWLLPVDAEVEPKSDKGRIKDLRLTATEKPAAPKDEDPKDPDKKKKL